MVSLSSAVAPGGGEGPPPARPPSAAEARAVLHELSQRAALTDRSEMGDTPSTPIARRTSEMVGALERSVFVGGYARVRVLRQWAGRGPATEPAQALDRVAANPTAGWSCWDVSLALVELLEREGICAGVTAGLGAEPGAPAEPDALVRVTDEHGRTFLADPYFGIGAVGASAHRWVGPDQRAHLASRLGRGGAEMLHVEHRTYRRPYRYHVLPGTLSVAQRATMAWQALDYGEPVRHVRGRDGTVLARVVHREDGTGWADLRGWSSGGALEGDSSRAADGEFHGLLTALADVTGGSRLAALTSLGLRG